jgi:hypothetical protein
MTYFQYYATTSRNLDRVLQYGVYPLAQTIGFIAFRNAPIEKRHRMASDFARITSAGVYSLLTTAFFGFESKMIDQNGREAVSAELGIDSNQIKFSDYKNSDNAIISKAYRDILKLQKYRYGTDALFVLPTMLRLGSKAVNHSWPESDHITKHPENYEMADLLLNAHMGWNYSVYAGKAAYWAGETYLIGKTGHYEIVKLLENLQQTGKDFGSNDLLGVYQRTRTDRKLPPIERKEEYDALRPLLLHLADTYNKRETYPRDDDKPGKPKMGIPEIVYLIGLGKINIHAADGKTISAEAVAQSYKEIDKVMTIGLKGIREENRKLNAAQGRNPRSHRRGLVGILADGAFSLTNSVINDLRKNKPLRPEEYITSRDPGELTSSNFSVNR